MPWLNNFFHRRATAIGDIATLVIRLVVGGIFLAFGVSKAWAPIEEFAAAIRGYELLPTIFVPTAAILFIVAEILLGGMLILGLFPRWTVPGTAFLLVVFMVAIAQVMMRGIPLENCGCSGGLNIIGDTPTEVLWRDGAMLVGILGVWWWFRRRGKLPFALFASQR